MPKRQKFWLNISLSLLLTSLLTLVLVLNWGKITEAIGSLSVAGLLLLIGLQAISFALRARAWGLAMRSAGREIEPSLLHASSGAGFLTSSFVPIYIGQLVRMLVLRSVDKKNKFSQMMLADGATIYVQGLAFLLLVIFCLPFLSLPPAVLISFVCLLFVSSLLIWYIIKKHIHREWAHVLRIFTNKKELLQFFCLLFLVVAIQPVRFYIALVAVGLDTEVLSSLMSFLATSLASLAPIGPAASTVGGIVGATGASLSTATAAGFVLSATGILAALLYLFVGGGGSFLWQRRNLLRASLPSKTLGSGTRSG